MKPIIEADNIYISAFSRCFYPMWLTEHSGYTFFLFVCSLSIEPTTFCAANAMLHHWATGTQQMSLYKKTFTATTLAQSLHVACVWYLLARLYCLKQKYFQHWM